MLEDIKIKTLKKSQLSEDDKRVRVTVHMGTCGIASGAKDVFDTFKGLVRESKARM